MQLKLDMSCHLLNVYTKFQIDISKHVEEKSGKPGRTDGQTDGRTDGHCHGIIRPFFKRAYKKGVKYDPNNYRPISLLSHFDKILEKIICRRLVSFLERNKILYCYQYGFRKLYSTALALIEITDFIKRLLDEKNYVISIFIDFKKAFDTVDHETLLYKLECYGIRGLANDFFRSYLTNRLQYTVINGVNSDLRTVSCGVP